MLKSQNILLIMRHAQSDPPNYVAPDFDRPLDPCAEEQILNIAHDLNLLEITIDHALVSSSRRTTQTFELLAKNLRQLPEAYFERGIYNASSFDILDILQEHVLGSNSLLLIGHNPSVSELSYKLTGEFYEFKPACVAILRGNKKDLASSLASDFGFSLEKILAPKR